MIRRALGIGSVFLVMAMAVAPPPTTAAEDPRAFITTLGTRAIEVLGPAVPEQQRLARFRELFHNDFDIPGIGQFVLGRYWRTASPQEQQEFLSLFQEYIVQAYSARLGQYGGAPFRVTGSRQSGNEIVVTSEILRPGGAPIQVDWFLTDQGGRYLITDVYVGGVSMKVTQRDEFASVIQRSGGQVGALLTQLRQKVAAAH
ncbi:MAG TPA: ABC transporter substrate-binding protein [Stellaceae bacterium]